MLLAVLLSAAVPGVKLLLSPCELNDAACCCALLIAVGLVPQYALSQAANWPEPPLGMLPKAEPFSSAASNCCNSCILCWSSDERFFPVDVVDTPLQKPPIRMGSVLMLRPQSMVSPTP